MMIALTSLPGFATMIFRGMPTVWRGRHRLFFCWLIFMQAVSPGRKTLEERARWTPSTITAWRFGRLLTAGYWHVHLIVNWLAQDLVAALPAPANGILSLFGDGRHADKRGTKHPVAQQGRISQHHPWLCWGFVFALARTLTPSQIVCIDQKRWAVELLNWERKSGRGVGEHQVSGDTNRSEKSIGIAVLASLFVLRVCQHEIVPGKPWSIFQLQHALRLRVMTKQGEHKVKVQMAKTRKAA